ncbi:carbamoyl-phosphate synthase large subunit [Algisphaera agarilytica]|uniref:Carbamoyl phosphate synthase large chain n=1 Tax=Algisphaera agarilytica TaxID=1385975 RepID=A0A7X0H6X1_9BACT|nr:carbamoyl-phosphate synthase large subunit [Algisphaera agarilytica]MBB6430388.1 carbamoyl-phosphate synthase large subunit [Algisphaera agarilytica]
MPKRTDLKTILIIGSGPIVIGQGCEFDYSGTQACKALREEGYKVVLINSNPATIMTDPEFADATYIEPINPEAVEKIIVKHKGTDLHIDAVLPTLGGQTALNCACALDEAGTFEKHGVEMIGATREVIYRAEDRLQFKEIMDQIGLKSPKSGVANTMQEAWDVLEETGLPAIIRPAFTLGGTGGGVAYNREEFEDICRRGLDASMTSQVLIDQSLLGWKEYEMEVMRDKDDNAVIICAIENFDAMGVHTGDSITVAPAQTLTDKEYQFMRDASLAILRAVGVETGGSNCQFAINPANGDMVVVEMNPRVSRSSALASKATGFPIAKIAAKLAVGYTLWELPNDITGQTVACFEPSIDYVVTKIPRWTFEKFPEADETLTTQMKSVGEGMSIGRTFKESMQKGIRSMEIKRYGYGLDANDKWLNAQRGVTHADGTKVEFPIDAGKLVRKLEVPSQGRWFYIRYAFKMGWTVEQVHEATMIDPWFLDQLKQLVDFENTLASYDKLEDVPRDVLFEAKQLGYSDPQLANLYLGSIAVENIMAVRARRKELEIEPVYKLVDTCAAEFEAVTPYYYSTYEAPFAKGDGTCGVDDEIRVSDTKKVVILGGGPNRIGQGIEFDYCCVQAAFAAQELGYEAVLVNSNPETVSTDYDTSDLLFFEPLTLEDVLNICERLNGKPFGEEGGLLHGVVVQYGGQTPLNLAGGLKAAGVPIIGTSVDSIDLAEDRDKFAALCDELGVKQPPNGIAYDVEQAIEIANRITYPVLVRPSFVLGGRAMETVFDDDQLRYYMAKAIGASDLAGQPILVDKFLAEATECDIDVIADFGGDDPRALVCGVLEHIEEAGIHSGDSACTIPPYSLSDEIIEQLKAQSRKMAEALGVRGLMNVQWAVKDGEIYVIEVNPRASRTVPFVGKSTGVSWARLAAKVMAGKQLVELGVTEEVTPTHTSIKESVFPFGKFPGVDVILGPEMRSTGECMGADADFPVAFAKAQMSAGSKLPLEGKVFLSVRESDKPALPEVAKGLVDQGFEVLTTRGTHKYLADQGIQTTPVKKIQEGGRPNALDLMKNGELALIINTPTRKGAGTDEGKLRATAIRNGVPMITTMTAAKVAVQAIAALRQNDWGVKSLQEYFPETARA